MRKGLKSLIIVIVLGIVLPGCTEVNDSDKISKTTTADSTSVAKPYDSAVIELAGIDSMTVFEILKASHEVEHVSTANGEFVRAIDSLENSSDFFWLYSVNGAMPPVASDKFITSNGDSIKWHYRRIEP